MPNLYQIHREELSRMLEHAQQRLDTLPQIDKQADPVFLRSYAGSMIPSACTAQSVARLEKAIATLAGIRSTRPISCSTAVAVAAMQPPKAKWATSSWAGSPRPRERRSGSRAAGSPAIRCSGTSF